MTSTPTHARPTTIQELEANIAGSAMVGEFHGAHRSPADCDGHLMYAREVIRAIGEFKADLMPWPDMRAALVDAEARAPLLKASWER